MGTGAVRVDRRISRVRCSSRLISLASQEVFCFAELQIVRKCFLVRPTVPPLHSIRLGSISGNKLKLIKTQLPELTNFIKRVERMAG